MKISRNLQILEKKAKWSFERSKKSIPSINPTLTPQEIENRMTYCALNLLNTWANFQRTFFICCLLGARSQIHRNITSNQTGIVTNSNDAIGKAILFFTPSRLPRSTGIWDTRHEPTWHDSNTLLRLSSNFSFSNDADIQAAFSFGFTAHKNLVVFRNYYAHKNQGTRTKAQAIATNYLIPQNNHPTKILLSAPSHSPSTTLVEFWAEEFSQTVELLCS